MSKLSISLNIADRFQIKQLFPQNSNMLTLALMKDISSKIDLSQEEIKEYELKTVGESVTWNPQKVQDKPTDFSEAEINFLRSRVNELDKQSSISLALYETCDKITKHEGCRG